MMKRLLMFGCVLFLLNLPGKAQTDESDTPTLLIAPYSSYDQPKQVYAIDAASGGAEIILEFEADKAAFSLSPTGDRLAYTAIYPEAPYFALLSIFDLEERVLHENIAHGASVGRVSAEPIAPSWSWDGNTVAVMGSDEAQQRFGLVLVGREETRVLNEGWVPGEWSSDDKLLLYHSYGDLTFVWSPFYILNIDEGGDPLRFTSNLSAWWIPDTHQVLTYQEAGTEDLIQWVVINTETMDSWVIPQTFPARVLHSFIRVDSQTLYVIEDGETLTVTEVDLGTGNSQPILTSDPSLSGTWYDYYLLSPDQQVLAVQTSEEIYFYDLESGALIQQTSKPIETSILEWIWRPDSSGIIFCIYEAQGYQTYWVAVDGSSTAQLLSEGVGGEILGWMGDFSE
jgi:Tol biopolymer transport system component